jgi:hypothetical protein
LVGHLPFLTILLYKTEPFTLNWRQSFLAIGAKVSDDRRRSPRRAKGNGSAALVECLDLRREANEVFPVTEMWRLEEGFHRIPDSRWPHRSDMVQAPKKTSPKGREVVVLRNGS